jgi:hypothetical protein
MYRQKQGFGSGDRAVAIGVWAEMDLLDFPKLESVPSRKCIPSLQPGRQKPRKSENLVRKNNFTQCNSNNNKQ